MGGVEKRHDSRYQKYLDEIKRQEVFQKSQSIQWICMNCGFLYAGETAPKVCPVCSHPQSYFEPVQK